jgi:hypothetical protein
LLNKCFGSISRYIRCQHKKTDPDEFKSKLLAFLVSLMTLQSPQQNRTGKTFDDRIHAETNERDIARYDACTDANKCFGEIPAEREIF